MADEVPVKCSMCVCLCVMRQHVQRRNRHKSSSIICGQSLLSVSCRGQCSSSRGSLCRAQETVESSEERNTADFLIVREEELQCVCVCVWLAQEEAFHTKRCLIILLIIPLCVCVCVRHCLLVFFSSLSQINQFSNHPAERCSSLQL